MVDLLFLSWDDADNLFLPKYCFYELSNEPYALSSVMRKCKSNVNLTAGEFFHMTRKHFVYLLNHKNVIFLNSGIYEKSKLIKMLKKNPQCVNSILTCGICLKLNSGLVGTY